MKADDAAVRGLFNLQRSHEGQSIIKWLRDRLEATNKLGAFERNTEEKIHYDGRARELYDILTVIEKSGEILNKRKL